MTDEKSDPIHVKFTGEAPIGPTMADGLNPRQLDVPEVPEPNLIFYGEAVKTFHRYCLHMFEQFQEDIFALQRRVQITEGLCDGYNELIPDMIDALGKAATHSVFINTAVNNLHEQAGVDKEVFASIISQLGAQCETNDALINTLIALQAAMDEMQESVEEVDDAVVELQDKKIIYEREEDDPYTGPDPTLTGPPRW